MQIISKINIPQPCSQSWSQMAEVPGGRHCESCNKVVTDFTSMTDAQIIAYISVNNKTCAKFNSLQLDALNRKSRSRRPEK